MSIQTEINRITQLRDEQTSLLNSQTVTIEDIKLALVNKTAGGGSVAEDLSSELNTYESYLTTQETTIEDILSALEGKAAGGGTTPTGEISIAENGIYDVTEYASANVNIPSVQDYTIEDGLVTRTITSYTNDRITIIGGHALRYAKITSLNCPNVTTIEAYALDNCTLLVDVNLPKVNSLKNYAMQNCKALVRLEFQQKITTQGAAWTNCSAFTTLILRGTEMSRLGNKNCFTGTPIASGTGYIYVPDNLVDSYKSSTNWSTYADQIKPLSELEG